jgi:RimJ/RimL family protein N-acetyltransferase
MRQEPPRHIAYLEARFRVIEGGRSRDGREQWLNWTAWERTTNAAVGLVEVTANEDKCVAIAYMVRPSLWRQGFGCEAVSAVIDGLFAAGAKLIEAKIDTRNRASLGPVAALGFAFIEKRIAVEWFKNAWSDEELWRLILHAPPGKVGNREHQRPPICEGRLQSGHGPAVAPVLVGAASFWQSSSPWPRWS